ncbi:MAG: DUF1129 family protein, partial [Streptococcaceae bacterium]|nr:DUF1129 family protein [Streptococcaceae bacterium]
AADGRSTYGVITTVALSLAGGFFFYMMYHFVYQYDLPGADRSKRPGFAKIGLVLFGSVLGWLALFGATILIPPSINFYPPGWVMIVVGLLAAAGRFYLKKKFNIRSSMMTRTQVEREKVAKNKKKK